MKEANSLIESKIQHIGYYCDEWIGMENAASQLAIFCAERGSAPKLLLYVGSDRFKWQCDLLIPVFDNRLPDAA